MPVEVIDLLSSPEAPALPRISDVPLVARRPAGAERGHAAASNPPARALSYEILDLTDDEPPLPLPLRSKSPPCQTKRRRDQIGAADHISLHSDDFDSTFDFAEDDRIAKKSRLSTAAAPKSPRRDLGRSHSTTTCQRVCQAGPSARSSNVRRWNSVADPIEYTSSPDVIPESSGVAAAAKLYDDEGLFVSPRVSPRRAKGKENMLPELSTKAAPKSAGLDYYDPFASSSPRPVLPPPRRHSPKQPTAWDPISSSAPEPAMERRDAHIMAAPRRPGRTQSEVIAIEDSEDEAERQSVRSDDSFPDIANLDFSRITREARGPLVECSSATASGKQPTRNASSGTSSRAAKSTTGATKARPDSTVDKERQKAEKAEKAAAREAERERKKQEKERAREQKAHEKARAAALAEVNKIRTDKKQSTPEMIVDLPEGMDPATLLRVEILLKELGVDHGTRSSPVDNVVRWRRKVKARYDADLGHWEPIPLRIEPESHALVLMTAAEFVGLALVGQGHTAGDDSDTAAGGVEAHVHRLQAAFPGHTLIYLIEGMNAWMRKNRTVRNRQYTAAVRARAEPGVVLGATDAPAPSGSQRRRKNPPAAAPSYVDEDVVEDALLELQVVHGALIHHTSAVVESAQWIAVFTQHISTVPYRRAKEQANDSAAFCMDNGQVRTGDDAADTYVRMLQEITRVTLPIAHGIASHFPSVSALVRGMEAEGPLALEDVPRSANKNGEPQDRAIGPAVSKRMHKVFTGRDPRSTEV